MNIWLPIITNLIILGIITTSALIGKRCGWKVQFTKLFLLLGACVGIYFLSPIITSYLMNLEFINNLCNEVIGLSLAFNSIVFLILYIIVYSLISIIVTFIARKCIDNKRGINIAKRVKIKGIDRKTTKNLKREDKKALKLQRKEERKNRSKVNKVFATVLGIILGFISAFIVLIPFKYISKSISNTYPEISDIQTGYEYTIYGQLDKIIDISDIINNIGE